MPDIRPAQRFESEMIKLEKIHQAESKQAMEKCRRVLIEILLRLGLNDAALPGAFRREVEALARQAAQIGRAQAAAVQAAAAELAKSQFEALGKFKPVPAFEAVQAATEAQRRTMMDLLDSAAWVEALAGRLLAETARLRASGEPVETAVEQLFAMANTDRASVWRMAAVNMELQSQLNLGTTGLGLAGVYYLAGQSQTGQKWFKQAIAQIDANTTNCCLAVHGQVQPIDKPFKLTGTPRFANRMMHPRFHWRCRTDEQLWAEGMEEIGQSTNEMRIEANAQRRKGK